MAVQTQKYVKITLCQRFPLWLHTLISFPKTISPHAMSSFDILSFYIVSRHMSHVNIYSLFYFPTFCHALLFHTLPYILSFLFSYSPFTIAVQPYPVPHAFRRPGCPFAAVFLPAGSMYPAQARFHSAKNAAVLRLHRTQSKDRRF